MDEAACGGWSSGPISGFEKIAQDTVVQTKKCGGSQRA